ncbi:MAG: tol-pal system protein YbgF [Betaproteobacteria bacterium]
MKRQASSTMGIVLRVFLLAAGLWVAGGAHAALFEDDEARKAILELRQKVEAGRLTSDATLQKLVEAQNDFLRKSAEDTAQLRRALLDMQNQIEGLKGELARSNGQREQFSRDLADLQREIKDLAQRQQDLARGVEERVSQLEPVKITVDGRDIMVEPAERRAYDSALEKFRTGDFAAAQSGFLSLISRFPKSGYLPSALFWLGNTQYATRDYKEAITNFRIMLKAAPDHMRAPEALLSIANCQVELKDISGARKTLDELGKTYPQSEAAKAGKERLARLR